MVWRAFGREGIAARIREHVRLALLFTKWVKEDARFEISAPTVIGVVCFRIKAPDDATADKLNARMVEAINAGGETYLMQTKLRGRAVMRMGLGNILTAESHLENVWAIIRRTADSLA
jgi:aromatic-L-amino-acid decarboxylase